MKKWLPYALFGYFMLLGLIMYGSFGGEFHEYMLGGKGDAANYIQMADQAFAPVENPFALRILSPFIVHAIKKNSNHLLGWDATWYLVTFGAIYLSAVVFYKLLRRHLKLARSTSVIFTLMLLHTYCYTQFHFQEPFRIDPMNNLFWMLAIYALFADRFAAFCIIVAIGSINKEVILLLAPLYPIIAFARTTKLRDGQVIRSVFAMLSLFAFYFLYRMIVTPIITPEGNGMFTAYGQSGLRTVLDSMEHQKEFHIIFSVFHFLWLFFAFMLYELHKRYGWKNRYLLVSLYLLAAVLFGRLFARDANRVFAMLAPMVIGLSAVFCTIRSTKHAVEWLILMLLIYAGLEMAWFKSVGSQVAMTAAVTASILLLFKPLADSDNPELLEELERV
ncbi:MAG: hypothetical protein KJ626_12955 [Verrucomicrobia bacterium]|nr:hypothetical protein [Verrucomicrobiota bacterium]